jgi:hypothetical protein
MNARELLIWVAAIGGAIAAVTGMLLLKARLRRFLTEKKLWGFVFLLLAVLFAIFGAPRSHDPTARWILAGLMGFWGVALVLLQRPGLIGARVTVYHLYGVIMAVGIGTAAAGVFIAGPDRWVIVTIGACVAAVPLGIWIWLVVGRRRDARDWPLERDDADRPR